MNGLPIELAERLGEYQRLAEKVRSLRDGVDRISATAYSPDGLITAVVGGRGELLDLVLDPRIYRDHDAEALASAVADTIRDAAAQAENDAVRLTEQFVGGPADRRPDPTFGAALHVLDTERDRGRRLWAR
ncbi:YbaB/EbfC family nucleoid-associated protein [Micromonospora sp. NBC_01813]|uniref:YbaB/EbfC family nucleoid-associated protein n=1 Tax=Micromonospora sp. NBC_01813 TaxID=2975988 RepID=UPI002DDA54CC|nr:YbaB/EbfC family nucleoid-associated protein [Micromonospora sp. NBC_01813]WSA06271.1 YbaB/EbfC family nucleoid-associated protein [Micromonospora sp. NBC_01813]